MRFNCLFLWILIELLNPISSKASITYDLAGPNLVFSGPWGYFGGYNNNQYGEISAIITLPDSELNKTYTSIEEIQNLFNTAEYHVKFIGMNGILFEMNNLNSFWSYSVNGNATASLSVKTDSMTLEFSGSDLWSGVGLNLIGSGGGANFSQYNNQDGSTTYRAFQCNAVNQATRTLTNNTALVFSSIPLQSYRNTLSDVQSVEQNFFDFSSNASTSLGYNSGNFAVTNNRLEFTTTNTWIGIKTLKTNMSLDQSWSTQVEFRLNNLIGLFEGNYFNVGIALSFGNNFSESFANRIVLKASQDLSQRTLGFKIYKNNSYQTGSENNTNLASFSEGVLKVEYDSVSKRFTGYFRPTSTETFIFLGSFNLDSLSELNPDGNKSINISIFAGSQPYIEPEGFAAVNSGDIYLKDFAFNKLSSSAEFSYVVADGKATITGYFGANSDISIPTQIDGYPITGIAEEAFKTNLAVKTAILPDGITSIGENAFLGCTNLVNASLPNSLTNIGGGIFAYCSRLKTVNIPTNITNLPQYVFYHCHSLTNIELPNNLKRIGNYNFANCYNLKNIYIPSQVETIENGAFMNCLSLTNFSVSNENPYLASSNGSILTKNGTTFLMFPSGKTGTFTIPNTVTNVSTNAFITSKINTLIIPSSVMSINEGAFAWCVDLSSIQINHGLQSLGDNAFYNCGSLTSVKLPTSVTNIGNWAFTGCSNLVSVSFPLSLVGNYQAYNLSDSIEYFKPISEIALEKTLISQASFNDGKKSITDSPNTYNLYTTNQIHNLGLGGIILNRDSNNQLTLNYQIIQSTDLQNWTPYQSYELPITNAPSDKMFLRVQAVGQ